MSQPSQAIVPSLFDDFNVNFIAANGTAAKILVDVQDAAAETALTPKLYGGAAIMDMTAFSTDVEKYMQFYQGSVQTTQDATLTGTISTTANTIVRAAGSFIADKWRVGDAIMLFAPKDAAPDAGIEGILAVISGITASTLTVNGIPFATVAAVAAGTRLCHVAPLYRAKIAASAGSDNTTPSQQLMDAPLDGSILRTQRKLSKDDIFAAAMVTAVGALPAYISVAGQYARY